MILPDQAAAHAFAAEPATVKTVVQTAAAIDAPAMVSPRAPSAMPPLMSQVMAHKGNVMSQLASKVKKFDGDDTVSPRPSSPPPVSPPSELYETQSPNGMNLSILMIEEIFVFECA